MPVTVNPDEANVRRAAEPPVTPATDPRPATEWAGAAQLTIEAFPEWDGTLPVPYGVIPFR